MAQAGCRQSGARASYGLTGSTGALTVCTTVVAGLHHSHMVVETGESNQAGACLCTAGRASCSSCVPWGRHREGLRQQASVTVTTCWAKAGRIRRGSVVSGLAVGFFGSKICWVCLESGLL